jgi:hypothetical protein
MMFAAGGPSAMTLLVGSTTSDDGANPKLHCSIAPMETWFGTLASFGSYDSSLIALYTMMQADSVRQDSFRE